MKLFSLVALLVMSTSPAMAYVGPGLGMGVIGTIFGVLAAIVLAVFGLLWYPMKRALKKRKAAAPSDQNTGNSSIGEQQQARYLNADATPHSDQSANVSKNSAGNHSTNPSDAIPETSASDRAASRRTRIKESAESEVS